MSVIKRTIDRLIKEEIGFHQPSHKDLVVTIDQKKVTNITGRHLSHHEMQQFVQGIVDQFISYHDAQHAGNMRTLPYNSTSVTAIQPYE